MDPFAFNPETDLEFTRTIAATPATVWRCMTDPELLSQWFCPKPWQVKNAVIEARPGGTFHTPMHGPDGEVMDEGPGCIVMADEARILAFTDAMSPGFHPKSGAFMTGVYILEASEGGTRLTARALHADTAAQKQHEEMGFFDGWGTAVDQLGALAETL
jgi:uncharacterized protein YndB with AHSA1/START domain